MLENEVSDEIDGLSSSFTTQHTVYRRLIREYEDENMRLRNEYKHHIPRYTSIKKHNEDIENLQQQVNSIVTEMEGVNRENKHLHETMLFLANQLNSRQSEDTSLDVSEYLDEISPSQTTAEIGKLKRECDEKDQVIEQLLKVIQSIETNAADEPSTLSVLSESVTSTSHNASHFPTMIRRNKFLISDDEDVF